jgi:hypothetical protein
MTMPPSEPEPTKPIPAGGEPTMPVPSSAGGGDDATMPAQGQPGGGGTGGPGGPTGPTDDEYEEGDNRRLWMIAGGILVLGLIVGVVIALVASGGGDNKSAAESTSTSSTSTTTTTTLPATTTTPPTTTATAPSITQFTASQSPVSCPSTTQINLTWSTQNATGVTISIDNPNGPFGNYGPTGNQPFPFACGAGPNPVQHTYYLRANGAGGQTTQQQLSVTGNFSSSSSSSSTT